MKLGYVTHRQTQPFTIYNFREDKLKHHLLKGCTPNSNGDLDQSIDSRDSRDSETHEEIDDDEDSK